MSKVVWQELSEYILAMIVILKCGIPNNSFNPIGRDKESLVLFGLGTDNMRFLKSKRITLQCLATLMSMTDLLHIFVKVCF